MARRRRAGGAIGAGIALACALGTVDLGGATRADEPDYPVVPLLARVDAEWEERDLPGKLDEIRATLGRAEEIAPDEYGVLWRLARLSFWDSDDPDLPNERKSELGKQAWTYGDRATAVNPRGVEGWYFAALGVGNYALGIGVLKALGEGIEGKFKERLARAQALNPGFLRGAVHVAWGRFYFELPWPRYDGHRSEAELLEAIRLNPDDVRGRVFLAELYQKEGRRAEARKLLERAAAHRPGAYDAAEERRSSARARQLLAQLGA